MRSSTPRGGHRTGLAPLLGLLLSWVTTSGIVDRAAAGEGDFVARDFHFKSGETLPELRLHYLTLGQPARDRQGRVANAVLILHGTGGSGRQFMALQFAGVLFGAGALLDTARYYIVLPDGIGHGR